MLTLNLLPEQYKVEYAFDRKRRFFVLILITFSLLLALFGALLAATVFYLNIQNRALKEILAVRQAGEYIRRAAETDQNIKNANAVIGALTQARKEVVDTGAIMEGIAALVPTGVYVASVSVDAQSGRVAIAGEAQMRDQMLAFAAALARSAFVAPESLENPDTNLLKERNFAFSFSFFIAGFERHAATKP